MKKSQGFNLIEIAVVLVVLGFLIGNLLNPLAKKIEQDKIKLTQHSLEEIKQALLGYAVLHGCLPCPVADASGEGIRQSVAEFEAEYRAEFKAELVADFVADGLTESEAESKAEKKIESEAESTNINICRRSCSGAVQAEGFIPWLDLGMGRHDAWGNGFRYRVIERYTDNRLAPEITSSLVVRSYPEEIDANYLTVKSQTPVVAIIYSYGQNGTSEQEDRPYIQDGYPEKQFDDILTWLSKNTVNHYLVAAGKRNFALTATNSEFTNKIMKSYLSE
jgi:prepilin-type N-terminal cleavage/methylation domain-containing protein